MDGQGLASWEQGFQVIGEHGRRADWAGAVIPRHCSSRMWVQGAGWMPWGSDTDVYSSLWYCYEQSNPLFLLAHMGGRLIVPPHTPSPSYSTRLPRSVD